MRISDWSSDVCSSDLAPTELEASSRLAVGDAGRLRAASPLSGSGRRPGSLALAGQHAESGARPVAGRGGEAPRAPRTSAGPDDQIGRESWRERVGQYV